MSGLILHVMSATEIVFQALALPSDMATEEGVCSGSMREGIGCI